MPLKKDPQRKIDALAVKLEQCAVDSKEYIKSKEEQKRWHRAKHQDTARKPLVPLLGTSIFVNFGQKVPLHYLKMLQICHRTPGFSGTCKAGARDIRGKGPRDAKKEEFRVWLCRVCGSEINSEIAEFILIVSELIHRLLETHGQADGPHSGALQERIAFFIKGLLAEACVEAVRTLCPQHFEMFVGMVNGHPNAQHTAVKVKVKSEAAGEGRMEGSPVAYGKARAHGGGGAAAVAHGGGCDVAFVSNEAVLDLSVACAGGGAAAPVRRGKGGGKGGGKKYVVAMLPPGASQTPKKGDGKFENGAVIYLIGNKDPMMGRLLAYFNTSKDMLEAMPSLPGAVVLTGQDLDDARLRNKESYDEMQAKRIARAAGLEVASASVSSKREGEGVPASKKRAKDAEDSDADSEDADAD